MIKSGNSSNADGALTSGYLSGIAGKVRGKHTKQDPAEDHRSDQRD